MKKYWAGLFVLWMAATALADAVRADDPQLRYCGRVSRADDSPVLTWPGSSVQARFEGSRLAVRLNDTTGDNFYNVIIDGQDAEPYILDCEKGEQVYWVATNLTAGAHDVLIFRRSEGFSGPTEFLGLELEQGKTLQALPPAPTRKIEFYGDSITCGMGNEAPEDGGDAALIHRNNYLAYGAITARNLNAEYRCIAKSGIGIIKSWFDFTMPEYYNLLEAQDGQVVKTSWNFSTWTPDVVVINLFQNDSWLVAKMTPPPTEEQIIQAYMDFVESIRREYAGAHIVCALGSMDATREDSPWPGYIETAVERMKDSNISTCFFAFDGFTKHPRVRHHRKNAEQLTAHIRKVMQWNDD